MQPWMAVSPGIIADSALSLLPHQNSRSFSARLMPNLAPAKVEGCMGLFHPRRMALPLALLKVLKLPQCVVNSCPAGGHPQTWLISDKALERVFKQCQLLYQIPLQMIACQALNCWQKNSWWTFSHISPLISVPWRESVGKAKSWLWHPKCSLVLTHRFL